MSSPGENKTFLLEQLAQTVSRKRVDTFSRLPLGVGVRSVSCGGSFMCCALASGAVMVMGAADLKDALCIGPNPVPLKEPVTDVVAGFSHIIAYAAGTDLIFSWGYNVLLAPVAPAGSNRKERTHQCGRNWDGDVVPPDRIEYLFGRQIVQVACGAAHTLVLTDAGEIFGLGRSLSFSQRST